MLQYNIFYEFICSAHRRSYTQWPCDVSSSRNVKHQTWPTGSVISVYFHRWQNQYNIIYRARSPLRILLCTKCACYIPSMYTIDPRRIWFGQEFLTRPVRPLFVLFLYYNIYMIILYLIIFEKKNKNIICAFCTLKAISAYFFYVYYSNRPR